MKIGVLNWRDWHHPESGGAELLLQQVARHWVEWGHQVFLHSSRIPGRPDREIDDGINVLRVGRLRNGTHHLLAPRGLEGTDVILESINTIPYMLPLRRGLPAFVPLVNQMAAEVWDAHLPRPIAYLAKRIEPMLYRPYRRVPAVAYSRSTASDLRSLGVPLAGVISLGGDGPQTLHPKAASPTFVFAGRLAANKRPDHAVQAFRLIKRELPQAKLWVLGEGPMRPTLARGLPEDAALLGRIPRDEFLRRMGEAHVLLVTSIREGWGLVVTEANSVGTPAVAYDVPGLRDSVLDDVTGVLSPQQPESLAKAALSLLREPERYARLRTAAVDWGGSRTWAATARELLGILEGAAALGASGRGGAR